MTTKDFQFETWWKEYGQYIDSDIEFKKQLREAWLAGFFAAMTDRKNWKE